MFELPKCKCGNTLVPFSDYSPEQVTVLFKTWACVHCEVAYRADKGVVRKVKLGEEGHSTNQVRREPFNPPRR